MPPPAEVAAEIVDSLELALEKFRLVAAKLGDVSSWPIPDFQTLMLPVLAEAARGESRIGDVVERLAEQFGLTSEERSHLLLPSGRANHLR